MSRDLDDETLAARSTAYWRASLVLRRDAYDGRERRHALLALLAIAGGGSTERLRQAASGTLAMLGLQGAEALSSGSDASEAMACSHEPPGDLAP